MDAMLLPPTNPLDIVCMTPSQWLVFTSALTSLTPQIGLLFSPMATACRKSLALQTNFFKCPV